MCVCHRIFELLSEATKFSAVHDDVDDDGAAVGGAAVLVDDGAAVDGAVDGGVVGGAAAADVDGATVVGGAAVLVDGGGAIDGAVDCGGAADVDCAAVVGGVVGDGGGALLESFDGFECDDDVDDDAAVEGDGCDGDGVTNNHTTMLAGRRKSKRTQQLESVTATTSESSIVSSITKDTIETEFKNHIYSFKGTFSDHQHSAQVGKVKVSLLMLSVRFDNLAINVISFLF
jgi:hypothetical protein